MGDRTYWDEECPNCGEMIVVCDAPSSLIWSKVCEVCGWTDGRDYYETGPNEISLLTKEQAQKAGLLGDADQSIRHELRKNNETEKD